MHIAIRAKFLLRVRLKYDNTYCCIRMSSDFIPWKGNITPYSTDFKIYKQLIVDNFGIDRDQAKILLTNNLHVIGMPQEKIIRNCQICQAQHVNLQDNLRDLKFLEYTEDDLENRILLLKEMGARYITTGMLRTCASRVHIVTFKAYAKIPKNEVIVENLYSHFREAPPELHELNDLNEYMTVKEYRLRCLNYYLKWRLEIPETNARLINALSNSLRYKSFSRMSDCFEVLHNDVGMSIETIRDNRCLTHGSSLDLWKILAEVPVIGGVSVKNLLKENPVLHKMKYKNVTRAKDLLDEFGIASEQLLMTPEVLLLDADALEVGLETIRTTPELKVLRDHPSLLQVLLTKDGVQRRIDYLRYLNISDATVNVLGKSVSAFDRYLRTGSNRNKGKEMALMLEKHLKKDVKEIQKTFKKHPFWRHVDLLTIHQTFEYLMRYFDVEDIYRNLQLLLYSKDKVEYFLSGLMEMNKIVDEQDRYTQSQLLALCAYQIEKKFHFTGDGVWDKSQECKVPTSPEELTQETEEWKQHQAKYPLNDVNIFLFINTNKSQRLP